VRLQVAEPLRRGILVQVDGGEKVRWRNFEYEFLPEFCFTSGIVGHEDKCCNIVQMDDRGTAETKERTRWPKVGRQ
jgi:hypothetical protein